MWLLNTISLTLSFFERGYVPPYAALSHTWGAEELKFQEMIAPDASVKLKAGYIKVKSFCDLVQEKYSLEFCWIDTCCINKESSADLSEAISSMYQLYAGARVCIIYLADVSDSNGTVPDSADVSTQGFRTSRWFTRGWTLQELIACRKRAFYTQNWRHIDTVSGERDIMSTVAEITGITPVVLTGSRKLWEVCVAERMSWAAHRLTTRAEDMAYCLMGIFDVNMPILYGEGLHSAFRRLQDEIMKASFDQTLFAWRQSYRSSGLLAHSPRDFANTPNLGLWAPTMLSPTIVTNIGILLRPCILHKDCYPNEEEGVIRAALQCDVETEQGWMILVLRLKLVENTNCFAYGQSRDAYRRIDCDLWEAMPEQFFEGSEYTEIFVVENVNEIETANEQDLARQRSNTWGSQPLIMSTRTGVRFAQTSLSVPWESRLNLSSRS